jgi:hypothetical protein
VSTTVTNQAELDMALADDSITHILIDSPAGVWLTIGDTHGKQVDIAGKSTIKELGDTARVGSMRDTARVEWMRDTASVGSMGDTARVEWMGDTARVEWMGDTASVEWMGDTARVEWMGDTARVGSMGDTARVEWMGDTARVGSMGDTASVEWMGDTARVGSMRDTARVGSMRDTASVEWMRDTASVGSMGDTARVESAAGTVAIQGVHDQATVHAGAYVAVHVYSATATVEGGHIIDLTRLDELAGPEWCEFRGIQVDKLRADLEWITAHPDEWDQGVWARKTACGTACCLAGTAVVRSGIGLQWEGDQADYTEHGVLISTAAAQLYGLSDPEGLFAGENSLRRLWEIASELTRGVIQVPADLPE